MAPRFSKNGKRLGRPPKNKDAVVFTVVSRPEAQSEIKEEKIDPSQIDTTSMIECEFVPITQHGLVSKETGEKKHGLYSSSMYAIEGINWDKWVAIAYLKADFDTYRKQGLKDREILQRCLNYLNIVPERKKYAKKQPTAKYGKLSLFKEDIQFTNKFGYECAILIFTTDQRKCELFWGEGEKFV